MLPRFSIVIPAYNTEATIVDCALSALCQENMSPEEFEVIVVDDCSTDQTFARVDELVAAYPNLLLGRTTRNGGPGAARNVGLEMAQGEWLLFLDSDDALLSSALSRLSRFVSERGNSQHDAVGFNWSEGLNDSMLATGKRRDYPSLVLPKSDMIRKYLHLHMDGSVIYTAIRRELITQHRLAFAAGYHEDVDFIFRVYWHAGSIGWLNEVLYLKRQRPDSIVNTISVRHLDGFLRAWGEISRFVSVEAPGEWNDLQEDWQCGLTSVIATRIREIYRHTRSAAEAAPLYLALYRYLKDASLEPRYAGTAPWTQYEMIAGRFMDIMGGTESPVSCAVAMTNFLKDVLPKTWSCIDLHHSVFLGPDQVRTCCKRFFVDGEMRGDVVLLESRASVIDAGSILAAKQELYGKINKGESTHCDGCPFMEFKEWGAIGRLDIRYLSLEHHSVCNLKCSYCSDTYYGGLAPQYDINGLLDDLLDSHALDACHTIVWGGGEPVVDKHFTPLIEKLAERLPEASQRVLTNAVKHSKTVDRLLSTNKVAVTTSIDAGSSATFKVVRGKSKLHNVLNTLKQYAAVSAGKITIKYIFTAENSGLDEVHGFVSLMKENQLINCNFQISSDFKAESISADVALSMIVMHGLLTRAGCQVIFFDDLLRHRLSDILERDEQDIREQLARLDMSDALVNPADYQGVVIWGAGWQARYMMERTSFLKHVPVCFFVDDTVSKIGKTYFDCPVLSPSALKDSDLPVIIAAAQGFPIIYQSFLRLGIAPDRLIRQLVL